MGQQPQLLDQLTWWMDRSTGQISITGLTYHSMDRLQPGRLMALDCQTLRSNSFNVMEECLPKQRLYDDGVTELIRWAADVARGRSPILDIGCGRGYLALALEDSEIHGVEIDSERAAEARTRYQHVYETDVDQFLHSNVGVCYEAAICIDALEHLANPEATLSNLRNIMRPQSILVAAIPNIAHISSRKGLLLGKWNYTDMGMLDRTHLRFFTYDTAQELVQNAGFVIHDVQVRNSFPRLLQPIAPLLKDTWPNLFGYHVLITAEVGR